MHNLKVNPPDGMFCLFYYIIFQFYSGVKVFYVLSVKIPNFYRYHSQSGPVLRRLTNPVCYTAQKVSSSVQFIISSFLTNSASKAHSPLVLCDLMYTNRIKQDDIFMIFRRIFPHTFHDYWLCLEQLDIAHASCTNASAFSA